LFVPALVELRLINPTVPQRRHDLAVDLVIAVVIQFADDAVVLPEPETVKDLLDMDDMPLRRSEAKVTDLVLSE